MKLVKDINNKIIETLTDIFYEWFIDTNCFKSGNSAVAIIRPYSTISAEKDGNDIIGEYAVVSNTEEVSTGAGLNGSQSRFKLLQCFLTLKVAKSNDEVGRTNELKLIQACDTFMAFLKISLGIPALQTALLKRVKIDGPSELSDEIYYAKSFIITFRVETA